MKVAVLGTALATVTLALPVAASNDIQTTGIVCPANTTPTAFQALEILPNGLAQPSNTLTTGVTYIIEATSTYTFAPGMGQGAGIADAAYSLRAPGYNNSSTSSEWVDGGVFPAPYTNWLELWINGAAVNWGPFNSSHLYTTSVVGAGVPVSFSILDDAYGDNSGSLSVSITSCTPNPTYTLTYTAGANGTLTGTSPQTVNQGASGSAVTAVPNSGYHFVNWSDASTTNPRTDTNVTSNISVTANFAANPVATYTITVTQSGHGTITPGTQTDVASGSDKVFTITPSAGYHTETVLVDGSSVGAVASYTFDNVTANHTITARFKADVVPPANDKNACKKGGWATMTDTDGTSYRNQGDCVSFHATKGKNKAKGPK